MLYKQSDARFGRSVGVALITALGAYVAYSFFEYYKTDNSGGVDSVGIGALAILLFSMILGFFLMFIKPKTSEFTIEVETEARKVTWPDWLTVKSATGQCVALMIILLGFLALVDYMLIKLQGVIL